MNNRKKLLAVALREGACLAGIGAVGDLVPASHRELGTAVSFAVRLSDKVVEDIAETGGPTHMYFHHYRTINRLIDTIALKLGMAIESAGYRYMPVAASQSINSGKADYSGFFSHKMAATRAGLGWVGKSGLLVTPSFGPRIRLGTVLTDWDLPADKPILRSRCGDCRRCVEACPAVALTGADWMPGLPRKELVDARACSEHMSRHYQHIGRGAVCGVCMAVCPVGKDDRNG